MGRFKDFGFLEIVSLCTILIAIFSVSISKLQPKKEVVTPPKTITSNLEVTKSNVLGRSTSSSAPQIYIADPNAGFNGSGGVISIASTDDPFITLNGYNINGTADINVYEANKDILINYLTHDKDGKQTKGLPVVSDLTFVGNVKKDISFTNTNNSIDILLPLKETGIWFLDIKVGQSKVTAIVIRSEIGVLTKEGDNEFVFWGQNFKTGKSITEGNIKTLSLQDNNTELGSTSFDGSGIAKLPLDGKADVAVAEVGGSLSMVPINLKYLNYNYSYNQFNPKSKLTRYFIFTDRPLYKPGDTIYFKAVLRDDDDARYQIQSGMASVKIYDSYYNSYDNKQQPIYKNDFPISSDGTINGLYELQDTSNVGNYTLVVSVPNQTTQNTFWDSEWSSNTISFDVQYFRKPEFTLDITTPKTELISGDNTTFTIKGEYFSGQPLIDQKVKYTVYSADYYEYQFLTDNQSLVQTLSDKYRYSYWYGSNKATEGTASLDRNGNAEINLNTKVDFNKGKSQVFSIEATLEDGSQNPAFARKNILVYAGQFGIYRKDYKYGSKVNTLVALPVQLVGYRTNTIVGGIPLTGKVHLENWVSFQEENNKYLSYKKVEEDLPDISAKTDNSGNATFNFTPTKTGYYSITVGGKDEKDNFVSKLFYYYVSSDDIPYYSTNQVNALTLESDKQKYEPTDTATLNIFSTTPDRDVFLSLERGRVNRFQVVHLTGKSAKVDLPLVSTDIPNLYANISSFSSFDLDGNSLNIPVSPNGKKLVVKITPDQEIYGPGDSAKINISTTDLSGNPISSDVAIWGVDKAIFELSDNKLGDIFDTFWRERSDTTQTAHSLEGIITRQAEGGGCFVKGTKVLMADGTEVSIENVKPGDFILTEDETSGKLVKAKVSGVQSATDNGYLIINTNLKVTPDHIVRGNGRWVEAGSLQIGDYLTNDKGEKVYITSIEWQLGKTDVYNLEVDKYHTYFADRVWVHNQKGGGTRTAFKDTAYWNPSVHTNSSGTAQVSFKLPDNLTTWTFAAVANTSDTRVGQTTKEIMVSKDVIVRPIVPNILRTGDEIVLTSMVQNFTSKDQNFDIELKFDSGDVDQSQKSNVSIKSNQTLEESWKVHPNKENPKAKLTFSAVSKTDSKVSDTIVQEVPVRPFMFEERRGQSLAGEANYQVKIADDARNEKAKITLSLSSTLIGTLPSAMKYLVDYPFGCVEQTTSRLVPALIAKLNSTLFSEALKDKDVDDIIQKAIGRLTNLQQGDGGWGWWSSGMSDPFVTSYVADYLTQAQKAGFDVNNSVFDKAKNYLEQKRYFDQKEKADKDYPRELIIAKNYGLTVLGDGGKVSKVNDLNNLASDVLSLAVMTNYLNGDKNPDSNGLNKLISQAKTQGDGVYWDGGDKLRFGSSDTSTALAIRAITLAGGDKSVSAKATRYLTSNRKYDYWSNTFATSQVIQALVDFSKAGNELSPEYSYTVSLDGKQIAAGSVTKSLQAIKDVDIPHKNIKSGSSILSIKKSGDGQIYSTLVVNEFYTDRGARSVNNGLKVEKEYVNEKGPEYNLAVGDTVLVKIKVSGLSNTENYGVITDELPSGLVPINENFLNEQFGDNAKSYYTSFDMTDKEITENGVVMSLYQMPSGEKTYSYKARVISQGTFIAPPATASLMYSSEIYGRSSVMSLKIAKDSTVNPLKSPQALVKLLFQIGVVALVIMILVLFFIFIKIIRVKKSNATVSKPPEPIEPEKTSPPEQTIKS
ncbi:hypothetical protein HY045_02045 [Candidatus Woesebacteria bacterium]|nr:hypothetical protein [Candidatus Woesebacteria bacterium]